MEIITDNLGMSIIIFFFSGIAVLAMIRGFVYLNEGKYGMVKYEVVRVLIGLAGLIAIAVI